MLLFVMSLFTFEFLRARDDEIRRFDAQEVLDQIVPLAPLQIQASRHRREGMILTGNQKKVEALVGLDERIQVAWSERAGHCRQHHHAQGTICL